MNPSVLNYSANSLTSSSLSLYSCHRQPALSPAKASSVSPFAHPASSHRGLDAGRRRRRSGGIRCKSESQETRASVLVETKSPTKVKAVVTVQATVGGTFAHAGISRGLDDFADLLGKSLYLELLSKELHLETGLERKPVGSFAHRVSHDAREAKYEGNFSCPPNFGEIGAVLLTNEHHQEVFIKEVTLTAGDGTEPVTIECKSWVHSKFDNAEKRIFFTGKSYLPSETPNGLQKYRERELQLLRGDGNGERKRFERIYDYDVYNDIGDPDDRKKDKVRPILGGSKEHPYPRRCRTGRPKTKADPLTEIRTKDFYIPRDEAFAEIKQVQFSAKTLKSALHAVVPSIRSILVETDLSFPHFSAIDTLYNEGLSLGKGSDDLFRTFIPRVIKAIEEVDELLLRFEIPEILGRDRFSWFRDEEFSRQTLAGVNPLSIQLLKEFPIVSKLDPEIYGPADSEITGEIIEREIKGFMTLKQALEEKKLFILDYHDILLPYVHKVRSLKGATLYGSRTVFFLTPDDTLRPVAIELTRPKSPTKPAWRRVFTPACDATGTWLWRLARAHVGAHDSGYHQLVSHWLRTHSCAEPYIIAANRQLSAMHPVYRLLIPHFRYTMEINALAREKLICADGIIESTFWPGKFAGELGSAAYGLQWRFDREALPADLIARGMAVEDPTAEHGLRLSIKDYPYAADGLLIWSAIKEWVTDYVAHYYPSTAHVLGDREIQAWWDEIRNVGHGDKKNEPWWPVLDSPESLAGVLTTIIWTVSGHHAAVNFGQYHFAGYVPNRPTIARVNLPVEEGESAERLKEFMTKPETELLKCLPSKLQSTVVMTVLDVLSSHSPDEEYLGLEPEPGFAEEPAIRAAFGRFNDRLKRIDEIIDERNSDENLKNRCGAGVVPYELLKPFSEAGVTGKGVPNSISI